MNTLEKLKKVKIEIKKNLITTKPVIREKHLDIKIEVLTASYSYLKIINNICECYNLSYSIEPMEEKTRLNIVIYEY